MPSNTHQDFKQRAFELQFGLLAPIWAEEQSFQSHLQTFERYAILAERSGFDSFWVPEFHGQGELYPPSPIVSLTRLATIIPKMAIGTCVLTFPIHHPVHVAESVAYVDQLSNGKVSLGVGLGSQRDLDSGFNINSVEKANLYEEQIDLLRKLWTQEHVDFEGKYYRIKHFRLSPKPYQRPCPPILLAGNTRAGALRAAKLGDGWIASAALTESVIRKRIKLYMENRNPMFNDRPDKIVVRREVFATEDESRIKGTIAVPLERMYSHIFVRGGLFNSESDVRFEEIGPERFITGTPEFCISAVDRYSRLGTSCIVSRMDFPGMSTAAVERSVRLFGAKVIQYFKES